MRSQSLFYWIIYSYNIFGLSIIIKKGGLNPYFTGLSILITITKVMNGNFKGLSQSLFYWIIYSYEEVIEEVVEEEYSLNPYFTGLSILIIRLLK